MDIIKKSNKYFKVIESEVNKDYLLKERTTLNQEASRLINEIKKIDDILNEIKGLENN